jgi:mannose-6-phosphate isomerase
MERERPALLGPAAGAHATFPWLVKFLDASDWLSVQVHPDEDAVERLWPGEGSKTEAWFVIDAAPGSRIYAGLLPGIDAAGLRAALAAGTVAGCLHHFEPQPGDCVFLPAGTVHAVGGGVLMAEVQQTSDATFRLFDWNRRDAQGRSRTLHVDEALACIDWTRGPVTPVRVPDFAGPRGQSLSAPKRQPLVRCRYFTLEYVQDSKPFACGGRGNLQALLILQGGGRLSSANADEALAVGQAWVLPAALPEAWCHPTGNLAVLLCTLPA